jgi:rhodanese-related sulfurtransferase
MGKHNAGFLALVDDAKSRIAEITIQDVLAKLEAKASFELVDVREAHEFERDRLPQARHLCKGILERDIEAAITDMGADLVLYCGGGYRSALAADALQRMGYTNVTSMAGGIRAWREADYPLER